MDSSQILVWANSLVESFGYLGLFIINFIGSASIFLPLPAFIVVFMFGAILNPWLVATFAALGCTLGELTGYTIGWGGSKILKIKYQKFLDRGKEWFKRGQGFLFIIIFAATPLPDDVLGILGGIFNYKLQKFLLASFIGKLIMNLILAFGGFYGINWILKFFKFNL